MAMATKTIEFIISNRQIAYYSCLIDVAKIENALRQIERQLPLPLEWQWQFLLFQMDASV